MVSISSPSQCVKYFSLQSEARSSRPCLHNKRSSITCLWGSPKWNRHQRLVVCHHTMQCCYGVISFLKKPRNKHPIAGLWGEICGVFCEFKLWFMLCFSRSNAVYHKLYWTMLWRHLTVFNSSPPSVAYMHQWIVPALVQKMACCLFGAKPLY